MRIFVAFVILLTASACRAAYPSVVYNATISPSIVSYPQFNPTIGALQAVYIFAASNSTSQFTAINNLPPIAWGNLESEFSICMGTFYTQLVRLNSGNYYLAQTEVFSTEILSLLTTRGSTYTSAAIKANFTGTGQVALPVTVQISLANQVISGEVVATTSNVNSSIVSGYVKYFYN